MRVAIVNDYEIVVRGLTAMLAPFEQRVTIVDLRTGGLPGGPVDVALFETFAGRRSALSSVDAMAEDPSLGKVVLYTWDLPDAFVTDTFKLSEDPQFVDKVRDVVGLYERTRQNTRW